MTSNRSFSNFSFFLGIFFLWSGCCLGQSPVLHLTPLTVERSCPIEDIDYISANVTLDMTGVDYNKYQQSVGLGEKDIVRSDFAKGTCDDSLTHMYCVKQIGDFYGFEYHQPINGFYSGMKMYASMWDTNSLNAVKSPEEYTYPMTANSATITVTVNNQTKQWRNNESQTFEFKDLDLNEPFNVSYMVRDNIQWAPDYKIGLKSSTVDLSTTDLNITTELPAGTTEFEISWQGGPCGQTVLIKLSEEPDGGDDDDNTPLIIGLVVGILLLIAVGAVFLFVIKRKNNTIRVTCSPNAKLDVLEDLAKKDPIVKKYIEDNNLSECQIRNKNDEVVSNKRTTVSHLMDGEPSSRVTVVIKHVMDTDKKTLILRVMDVKMIKDSEGHEMDPKGGDMGPHNSELKPLPAIVNNEKDPDRVRKMKKKNKKNSNDQSDLMRKDQMDQVDGKTTKTNKNAPDGRHSPGRPLNDTRIHPDSYNSYNVNGGRGDGENFSMNINTSQTTPLPLSTNFPTDSSSSINNSNHTPRKLPPLKLPSLTSENCPLPQRRTE